MQNSKLSIQALKIKIILTPSMILTLIKHSNLYILLNDICNEFNNTFYLFLILIKLFVFKIYYNFKNLIKNIPLKIIFNINFLIYKYL